MKKLNILSKLDSETDLCSHILNLRGIKNINSFLLPQPFDVVYNELSEDFRKSLTNASSILRKSINEGLSIVIHGDYDTDGICATAILYDAIKNGLKYSNVHYFIPNRFDHGYGISKESVDTVIEKLNSEKNENKILFITVDSGITAVETASYIKSLGHLLIITDHHQKPSVLPDAEIIVWCDEMVGSSIAWLFAKNLEINNEKYLAYAALATITDLHPVLGFNRYVVKQGLQIFNSNIPISLKSILQIAGKIGEITTYDLGWVIGPRLNATGRLQDATEALELLLLEDENIALEKASRLNQLNVERQNKTYEMFNLIPVFDVTSLPKILFSANTQYHEGIIGLLASKLTQKYFRPSIVVSLSDEFGKGSVRSIPGIDIISILKKYSNLFENLGGHPMAAGFTITRSKLPELEKYLKTEISQNIDDSLLEPIQNVDVQIPFDLLSLNFIDDLERLKPYGVGNEEPVFYSSNIGVVAKDFVGKESQHLVLKFISSKGIIKGILFNAKELSKTEELHIGDKVDIVYVPKKTLFNDKVLLELIIKDIKRSIKQLTLSSN